jgi:hypothetical protein
VEEYDLLGWCDRERCAAYRSCVNLKPRGSCHSVFERLHQSHSFCGVVDFARVDTVKTTI